MAFGRHSLLWPKATTFENYQWPEFLTTLATLATTAAATTTASATATTAAATAAAASVIVR